MNRRERSWLTWTGLALLLVGNLPYLIAWAATPADAHFTGLVFNPIDGHSYLAKMREGLEGSWRYHLAFTPERSPGAPIFLFHLWLGHLARCARLPLVAVYHAARILGAAAMLVGIYGLTSYLSAQSRERGTMFLLTALGSGLGWLLLAAGVQTADLWVPEAFPGYSLMTNAHFPLAIGLMAGIAWCGLRILSAERDPDITESIMWPWGLVMALAALFLSAIQPFGLVPVFGGLGLVLFARTVSNWRKARSRIPWRAGSYVVAAAAAALPYPVYMQTVIRSDPLLALWNAQNVTASPPLWDWALSYGLVSLLAVWGCSLALQRFSEGDLMVLGWALVTFVGMYLPLQLQRRLSIGLGVPMGLLAGLGWWRGIQLLIQPRARNLVRRLVIAFSALTLIFLVVTASLAALSSGTVSGSSWLYVSDGEWAAMSWLREHKESGTEAVVLCAPQMGSFIPAWTGQRVVYGHPFETVNAEQRVEQVKAYWSGAMRPSDQAAFLKENRVRYILVGPRERALAPGGREHTDVGNLVFDVDDTQIYALDG